MLNITTSLGNITISNEVIASIVGAATTECYGVVGMSSQKIRDGIAELLKRENFSKGISIVEGTEGPEINIHIIVMYGVKISEVSKTIQEKVHFDLINLLGYEVAGITVKVESVKMD